MMYHAALAFLLAVALLSPRVIPFAIVLLTVWVAFVTLESLGLYRIYPWVDAVAIYPLAYLAQKDRAWWSIGLVMVGLLTCASHVVFWASYLNGVYLGAEYVFALRGLFLASAALLIGGVDAGPIIRFLERSRGVLHGHSEPAVARGHSHSRKGRGR